ncbi:glycosyltransferase involved in cell wall biosynthesis [Nocardiopsis mwathae]|uniref:Glycosyltransferase involved in cell wall biosynthesis n=1 Tax=Nocardiopsis mwathae TaxID=1472723 RepID=A0A7X0D3I5_9ACTN|nr:glycosyltransferase family 4 protein [Nocardiopsis mwathae]MBB6170105.1 glycosyltransferase involved in cell wall biosynthesis [Nocardiopsis mwathae]
MRITFLIGNIYGMGGTIRATSSLANGLCAEHDVEIVSLAQNAAEPFFPIDPRVRLHTLTHSRGWTERPEPAPEIAELEPMPAEHVPGSEAERANVFNAATEREVRRYLDRVEADVVVATSPGLNSLLAKFGRPDYLRIGQEHENLGQRDEGVRAHIRDVHTTLDGVTVLTDADRAEYAAFVDAPDEWAVTMPNPLPERLYATSRLTNPIIATAGRLVPVKQYPLLVRAFAAVADKHPDWQLRIYGRGAEKAAIRAAIDEHGLHGRVALMGRTPAITDEFAKASIVAVSSAQEGFGMTIVEAFAVGVPVVSFDCPFGPRELITDGHNGLLVADQDVDALSAGLLRLVEDADERRRLGAATAETAARFHIDTVTARWERYLEGHPARRRKPSVWSRIVRPWRR